MLRLGTQTGTASQCVHSRYSALYMYDMLYVYKHTNPLVAEMHSPVNT